MKDGSNRISNIFWPLISSRFVMSKFTDQSKSKYNQEPDRNFIGQNDNIPIGLIDSILWNNEYKDLIEELGIGEFENIHALDMNDYLIKNSNNNKYTPGINQEHRINSGCDSEEQKCMLMTEKEIEVILLWRTSSLSLTSIGIKTGF